MIEFSLSYLFWLIVQEVHSTRPDKPSGWTSREGVLAGRDQRWCRATHGKTKCVWRRRHTMIQESREWPDPTQVF